MTKPADITLSQLGGRNRLAAMIGAKDFHSDNDGLTLTFKFMKTERTKATNIAITLDTDRDLYTVEFIQIKRKKDKELGIMIPTRVVTQTYEQVFAGDLVRLFEEETGLYLTL